MYIMCTRFNFIWF